MYDRCLYKERECHTHIFGGHPAGAGTDLDALTSDPSVACSWPEVQELKQSWVAKGDPCDPFALPNRRRTTAQATHATPVTLS